MLSSEPCVLEDNALSPGVTILNQNDVQEGGIIPHYGVLEFKCIPGYTLQGSSITTCLDTEWSQQFPICEPGECIDKFSYNRFDSINA